jgi:hypothetical protein
MIGGIFFIHLEKSGFSYSFALALIKAYGS